MRADDPTTDAESNAGPTDWGLALAANGDWLRAVVETRLGERQAVDEVMQEISLAAVAQRAPLLDPTKVAPWLYRLAILKVLLHRRRSGRRAKLAAKVAERSRPNDDATMADPLGWLLEAERGDLVRGAIGRLPRADAEILLMKYAENLSYRQLADRLGRTEAAIESRLHRARARLRDELRRYQSTLDPNR